MPHIIHSLEETFRHLFILLGGLIKYIFAYIIGAILLGVSGRLSADMFFCSSPGCYYSPKTHILYPNFRRYLSSENACKAHKYAILASTNRPSPHAPFAGTYHML